MSCLAVAVIAPLPYLTTSLPDLAKAGSGLAKHYAGQSAWIRAALIVHASSGGLALLLVPVQTLAAVRRRWPLAHRMAGRVAVGLMLVASVSGLIIAQVSYARWSGRIGFSALALAWGWSAVRTVKTAQAGNLRAHREWATRCLAVIYAAVTLRLWLLVMIGVQRPIDDTAAQVAFDRVYPIVPFLSWIPNVLVAEWVIRRRRRRRPV